MDKSKALMQEINQLKKERDAIIAAHYYQKDEIQEIADIVGDSYLLAKKCAESDKSVICFCGVDFMAESAKLLSPQKTVIIPEKNAGCRMADMITGKQLIKFKAKNPGRKVMCYINTTAEVKAESDICVTSSNAVKIAKNYEAKDFLFVPDMNLGRYIAEQLPEKKFTMWEGYCPTHHLVTAEEIKNSKKEHPGAKIAVHPECTKEVLELADFTGSTQAILDYVINSDSREFIIGTEEGILYQMKKQCPEKKFYLASSSLICFNMKQIDLEKLRDSLKYLEHQVEVDEKIAEKASVCLEEMMRYG